MARAIGPVRCWNSKATGGPPTALAVPKRFEKKPAASAVRAVVRIAGANTLRITPDSVVPPTMIASSLASAARTMSNPSAVPGSAPASIHGSATRSSAWCSRRRVVNEIGSATITSVAGNASGTTSATNGAEIMLRPTPIEPCTTEPMSTAVAATANSPMPTCTGGSLGGGSP